MAEVEIGEKVTLAVDEYGMPDPSATCFVDTKAAEIKMRKALDEEEFEDEEELEDGE